MHVCLGTRGDMKPLVELAQQIALEKRIRRLKVRDAYQSQRLHQTVLQDTMPPLDAALRLWAVRQDQFNLQSLHRTSELCQWRLVAEGLIHRRISSSFVNTVSIHVQRTGQSVALHVFPKRHHRCDCCLTLEELCVRPVRRLIDEHHQRCPLTAPFEPVVLGAVHLDQFSAVCSTLAPGSMTSPSAPRLPQPRLNQPASQRLNAYLLPVHACQILHRECGTEVVVLASVQGQDSPLTVGVDPPIRLPLPQPMLETGRTFA